MLTKQVKLRFIKLSENASIPTKGSEIAAHGREIFAIDIQIEHLHGCYGRIAPRSGLAFKNGIDVGAGLVDEDYRGNLKVVLFNRSDTPFIIKKGDRIAQLICQKIYYPEIEEVENLSKTKRGEKGFGSTNIK
ncbi:deoxyuridine 5'-triphosphate nucleotidohydrolase-like [Chrysoperla carnea]|uniref:deoxyuridine 5'-triphosphate nucleotidohydrolase-like n=1 Tax=Chrysoperla carnea TaxID=189513 RepID=UPI001D0826A8|nr:deoxyuridine 5'-triphosphate nucleotidohydrolase-like [Chrysoperla carnea]